MGADPGLIAVRVLSFREMTIELLSDDCARSVELGRSEALGEAVSANEEDEAETEGTGRESASEPSRSHALSLVAEEAIPHALSMPRAVMRLLA